MNIFVLDLDTKKCARYHNDKHVVKMILETAQLLSGVHHMTDQVPTKYRPSTDQVPYKLSHKNHPCAIWARKSIENYIWLCDLGLDLCKEYTFRYDKRHKSQAVIEWCLTNKPNLEYNGGLTPFALAMPDECKIGDVVDSYREYYRTEKRKIAQWKGREVPEWFS